MAGDARLELATSGSGDQNEAFTAISLVLPKHLELKGFSEQSFLLTYLKIPHILTNVWGIVWGIGSLLFRNRGK